MYSSLQELISLAPRPVQQNLIGGVLGAEEIRPLSAPYPVAFPHSLALTLLRRTNPEYSMSAVASSYLNPETVEHIIRSWPIATVERRSLASSMLTHPSVTSDHLTILQERGGLRADGPSVPMYVLAREGVLGYQKRFGTTALSVRLGSSEGQAYRQLASQFANFSLPRTLGSLAGAVGALEELAELEVLPKEARKDMRGTLRQSLAERFSKGKYLSDTELALEELQELEEAGQFQLELSRVAPPVLAALLTDRLGSNPAAWSTVLSLMDSHWDYDKGSALDLLETARAIVGD